jgi:hypothetical protein
MACELGEECRLRVDGYRSTKRRLKPAQRGWMARNEVQRLLIGLTRIAQSPAGFDSASPLGVKVGLALGGLGDRNFVVNRLDESDAKIVAPVPKHATKPLQHGRQRARESASGLIGIKRSLPIRSCSFAEDSELEIGTCGPHRITSAEDLSSCLKLVFKGRVVGRTHRRRRSGLLSFFGAGRYDIRRALDR